MPVLGRRTLIIIAQVNNSLARITRIALYREEETVCDVRGGSPHDRMLGLVGVKCYQVFFDVSTI